MNGRKSVLVVDDDIALLKYAEELIGEHYTVSLAKSGEQALQLLRKGFLPDIILLDIDMPHMDGYETIREIAGIDGAGEIPVVFLTGLTESEAEIRGLRSGAADYITKPFVKEILIARLELHLKNAMQQKQLHVLQHKQSAAGIDEQKFAQLSVELTETEKKIARLIAMGFTNQEIGEHLHYSYSYVKKVVVVIFEKLAVNKRNELRKLFT